MNAFCKQLERPHGKRCTSERSISNFAIRISEWLLEFCSIRDAFTSPHASARVIELLKDAHAGEVDVLIAATAMAHKATLVTANKKHFENIEGLKIKVWLK